MLCWVALVFYLEERELVLPFPSPSLLAPPSFSSVLVLPCLILCFHCATYGLVSWLYDIRVQHVHSVARHYLLFRCVCIHDTSLVFILMSLVIILVVFIELITFVCCLLLLILRFIFVLIGVSLLLLYLVRCFPFVCSGSGFRIRVGVGLGLGWEWG